MGQEMSEIQWKTCPGLAPGYKRTQQCTAVAKVTLNLRQAPRKQENSYRYQQRAISLSYEKPHGRRRLYQFHARSFVIHRSRKTTPPPSVYTAWWSANKQDLYALRRLRCQTAGALCEPQSRTAWYQEKAEDSGLFLLQLHSLTAFSKIFYHV